MMSCKYCHECTPIHRKDGYCSDICQINSLQLEITHLRALAELVPGLVEALDNTLVMYWQACAPFRPDQEPFSPYEQYKQTLAHAREVMEETK